MQIVEEAGDSISRGRLLVLAGGAALGALGLALVTPAASLGPVLDVDAFFKAPWRRGRRLVDEHGRPLRADEIEQKVFYTAYPEGADREEYGSPLVIVRLDPRELDLPPERHDWAPRGIVAYSKICTHAGCAISLYRVPTFAPVEPKPALVCPCHYSTFDPAKGGDVLFGPAGRPLPQLPLTIDSQRRAARRGELLRRGRPVVVGRPQQEAEGVIAKLVRYVDERTAAASYLKKALRYLFPDHWSFLLGEVALYSFVCSSEPGST